MAATQIKIPIRNVAQLVGSYDRVLLLRSTDGGKAYLELTRPDTRPVLSADKFEYVFTDPAGAPSYLYAAALYNTRTQAQGPMSEPVPGTGNDALSVMSVDQLKEIFLSGLPDYSEVGPFSDEFYQFYISSAVAIIERRLDLFILPRSIQDEGHTYFPPKSGLRPMTFVCFKTPVRQITGLRFAFPYQSAPSTVPLDWVTLTPNSGQVTLYPRGGFLPILSSAYSAYMMGGATMSCVPQAVRVDYLSGFERGKVPDDLRNLIGMQAALGPLGILSDLIAGPGVASTSISHDGLGQSISSRGFDSRITNYTNMIENQIRLLRQVYRGVSILGA